MRTINLKEIMSIQCQLFRKLTGDVVDEMPALLQPLIEANIDLNEVYNRARSGILESAIRLGKHYCLAYFLNLGLDPFKLDSTSIGWSAAHVSVMRLDNVSLRRLMGLTFADPKFLTFKRRNGTSVKDYFLKAPKTAQAAFCETQTIFYAYRDFHEAAEEAENCTPPNHLLAALNYFFAAKRMKTEVADKEDDPYLKRFHLKKVVMNLQKAVEHYYQAILVEGKIPDTASEFNVCLILSEKMIGTIELDHPDIDWEIKLGDADTFRLWNEQLMLLQNWQEERRIGFSSTGSGSSATEDNAGKADERTALLGESTGLRC